MGGRGEGRGQRSQRRGERGGGRRAGSEELGGAGRGGRGAFGVGVARLTRIVYTIWGQVSSGQWLVAGSEGA